MTSNALTSTASTSTKWRVALLEDDARTREFFESCVVAHERLRLAASFATLAAARAWFKSDTADVLLCAMSATPSYRMRK